MHHRPVFLCISAEPPPPPTDLKASIIQSTKVQLEWKPPRQIKVYQINGVTVQIKYASENNAEFINREELDADASGVTLDGLEPDTEYLLRVVSHRFGSPGIKLQILLSCLNTFLTEVVRRSC